MGYAQEKIMPYGNKTPKGKQVERMFDNIAHSYDLLNHWLSFGIDRRWRRKTIDVLKSLPHEHLLDVATGTGDFAMLACRRLSPRKIVATDLSEGMMDVGRNKVNKVGMGAVIEFRKEDCMKLSFADNSFDAVTVAYGVRNFENLEEEKIQKQIFGQKLLNTPPPLQRRGFSVGYLRGDILGKP